MSHKKEFVVDSRTLVVPTVVSFTVVLLDMRLPLTLIFSLSSIVNITCNFLLLALRYLRYFELFLNHLRIVKESIPIFLWCNSYSYYVHLELSHPYNLQCQSLWLHTHIHTYKYIHICILETHQVTDLPNYYIQN